jgi:SAM-dependent methyltransferase
VLDVGCGAGAFMEVARDAGFEVQGIDVSEASAQLCRSRGLSARTGDFLTEDFEGKFDLITMWDVVEHLRDPEAFLKRACSLLSKRGVLFAKIPAFGELSVRISARIPAAGRALLGAPDHVQYFSKQSLSALLVRVELNCSWVSEGRARSAASGGSLKRRVSRRVRDVLKSASGDENLYVIASA